MVIAAIVAVYLLVGLLLAFKETKATEKILQSDKPYNELSNDEQTLKNSFESMIGILKNKNTVIAMFFVSVMLFWFPTQLKDWYDKGLDRVLKAKR